MICNDHQDSAIDLIMVTSNLAKGKWKIMTDTSTNNLTIIITLQVNYKLDRGIEQPTFHYSKENWEAFLTEIKKKYP